MSYSETIRAIEILAHSREFTCPRCVTRGSAHVLAIYAECVSCGETMKLRALSATGSEIEDVVEAVLRWLREEPKGE